MNKFTIHSIKNIFRKVAPRILLLSLIALSVPCLVGTMYAGDFFNLIWAFDVGSEVGFRDATTFNDINGDGIEDVVVATQQGEQGIYALSGADGSELWSYAFTIPGYSFGYQLDLHEDLNNDGIIDIAISFTEATDQPAERVKVLDAATGEVLWTGSVPVPEPRSIRSVPDVNGDGVRDVAVGCSIYTYGIPHNFFMFDGSSGLLLWSFDGIELGLVRRIVDLDVDNDSEPEIVADTTSGKIYSLSGSDGSLQWSFEHEGPGSYPFEAIDGVAVVTPRGESSAGPTNVYRLNGTSGNIEWEHNAGFCHWSYWVKAVEDLTGDENDDVAVFMKKRIINGCENEENQFKLLDGQTGQMIWSTNVGTMSVASLSSMNDTNVDGSLDIVAVDHSGAKILILNGSDGQILHELDLDVQPTGAISVNDLSGDSVEDLLVLSFDAVGLYEGEGQPANTPPVFVDLDTPLRVRVGEKLVESFRVEDIDGDNIVLKLLPLSIHDSPQASMPKLIILTTTPGYISAQLVWKPIRSDVQEKPYLFALKAADEHNEQTVAQVEIYVHGKN